MIIAAVVVIVLLVFWAISIYNNIIREVGDKNTCVVLMHDTNATKNTAAALPDVIRWFKNAGYRFDTVDHLEKKI